jgi:hypothetical protein
MIVLFIMAGVIVFLLIFIAVNGLMLENSNLQMK